MQRDTRKLLCQLTRWVEPGVWLFLFIGISFGLINYRDESTTAELNELLYSRIMDRLHLYPNLVCRYQRGENITCDVVFPGLTCLTRNAFADGLPGHGGFLLGAEAQDR